MKTTDRWESNNHLPTKSSKHTRSPPLSILSTWFSRIIIFIDILRLCPNTAHRTIVSSLESNRVSVTQKVWTPIEVLVSRVRQFRGKEIGKIWCAYAVHSWFRLQTDNRLGTRERMVWNGREMFSSSRFRWVRVIWGYLLVKSYCWDFSDF